MSEPEGFLSRWTRLKHEAGEAPEAAAPEEPREPGPDSGRAAPPADGVEPSAPASAPEAAVDLSALPPIEFDHRHDRHPRVSGAGGSGRIDPCGPSPRVGRRSEDSRLRGHRREPVGLHRAGRDAGVRPARPARRCAPAGRARHGRGAGRLRGVRARRRRKFSRHGSRRQIHSARVARTERNPGEIAAAADEPPALAAPPRMMCNAAIQNAAAHKDDVGRFCVRRADSPSAWWGFAQVAHVPSTFV